MFKIILFSSIFTAAVYATGEFTILNSPKSLSFKGSEVLNSDDLSDIIQASLGSYVSGESKWSGLYITDPFTLPRNVVTISLDGITNSKLSAHAKTYQMEGHSVQYTLNAVSTLLEAEDEKVCVVNFENLEEALANLNMILEEKVQLNLVGKTEHLNAQHYSGDKQFMQSLDLINVMTSNVHKLQDKCNYLSIHLSLDSISKERDATSPAITEALTMFTKTVGELVDAVQKSSNNQTLILAVVNKDDHTRVKREEGDEPKIYNLAGYYSDDYPVIFNIILWFMVVFAFCLLAVSYSIGTMDPGRDSIIYRMTSTRMKKDN